MPKPALTAELRIKPLVEIRAGEKACAGILLGSAAEEF
jgi:hypothetical protein